MTKPDDIPQDVMAIALDIWLEPPEMIARAIMAEREACAQVAEERRPLWEEAEAIAAAIRNRGAAA